VDESEFDIPDESEALLIHNDSTFEYDDQLYVYIQYEVEDSEDDTDQLVEGYVDAERVVLAEDVEEYLENRQQGEETESESDDNDFDEAEELKMMNLVITMMEMQPIRKKTMNLSKKIKKIPIRKK